MVGLTIMLSRDGGLGGEVGGDLFLVSAKFKKFFIKFFFFFLPEKKTILILRLGTVPTVGA